MGWSGVKNGQLLRLAALEFEAFITVDKNLQYQQDLSSLPVAIIVLFARSNELAHLLPLVPDLMTALSLLQPRTLVKIGAVGKLHSLSLHAIIHPRLLPTSPLDKLIRGSL